MAPPGSAYAAIPPAKYTTGQAPQALEHVRRARFVTDFGRGTVSPSQQPSKGPILLQSGGRRPLARFRPAQLPQFHQAEPPRGDFAARSDRAERATGRRPK